jgi:glycerol-3-phosphate cytidylyltransferase
MKKYRIGYTQGVFDMFHIGHLNLINNAKQYCDYLIVGVNGDTLVQQYKHKTPVIREEERLMIVQNIKAVDKAVIATTLNKLESQKLLKYDAIFIGDDWKESSRWKNTQKELAKIGVDVVFLPHTYGISSTILRIEEEKKVAE